MTLENAFFFWSHLTVEALEMILLIYLWQKSIRLSNIVLRGPKSPP